MLPFQFIGSGFYTNPATAVAVNVAVNDKPDFFRVTDISPQSASQPGWGNASGGNFISTPQLQSWIYFPQMANGLYKQTSQLAVATTAASLQANQGTSGGFTFIDSSNPPTFAALAATAINHTTFVVSMTNTGSIAVGDTVRINNPVGMLQAAGIVGQVTAVSANTSITLGYIATAVTAGVSFTADATSASILKFFPSKMYPRSRRVMFVQQATQPKVYFAEKNDFTVGELVDFNIPSTYGMSQLSFLAKQSSGPAQVIAVTNSATESSITLNFDTSGFTAFSYPTSAASVGAASPPTCFPAGSGVVVVSGTTTPVSPPGTNLADSFDNLNQFFVNIGINVVGANSSLMFWEAWKGDFVNLTNA